MIRREPGMLQSKFGVEEKGIIHEFGAIFGAERFWLGQASTAARAWFFYNRSKVFRA